MIVGTDDGPVFLFLRDAGESLHVRLAVGTALGDVRVFDRDASGMRTACAIVRAGGVTPSLVLVEEDRRGETRSNTLATLRNLPELGSHRLVILGDGDDPDAERFAYEDGADGFIALPRSAADSTRLGEEIVRHVFVNRYWKTA
jgi:hypothetical protein